MILNLTPDHLERHKTMENYALTKCRILSHMSGRKMGVLPLGETADFDPNWKCNL